MKFKIAELASINKKAHSAKSLPSVFSYLDTGSVTRGIFEDAQVLHREYDKIPSRARRGVEENDIVFSTVRPNQEHYGFITNNEKDFIVSTGFTVISPDENKVNPYYLFSWLTQKEITETLQAIAENSTSAYPSIKSSDISNLELDLPDRSVQDWVSGLLWSIHKKTEVNRKSVFLLEALSKALFKHWFIDFEFPDAEGRPYKSSGGKMMGSELGDIPEGWVVKELGDFFDVKTGKKNANAATEDGKYAFFTCSKGNYLTDNYSFEGQAILLAGNGNFSVKRYNGKFDAYQRTYVLQPHENEYFHFLYESIFRFLDKTVLGNRGSVISFITKGMIENYKIVVPPLDIISRFNRIATPSESLVNNLKSENKKLTETRDTLLPKLLSGELNLPQESEVTHYEPV